MYMYTHSGKDWKSIWCAHTEVFFTTISAIAWFVAPAIPHPNQSPVSAQRVTMHDTVSQLTRMLNHHDPVSIKNLLRDNNTPECFPCTCSRVADDVGIADIDVERFRFVDPRIHACYCTVVSNVCRRGREEGGREYRWRAASVASRTGSRSLCTPWRIFCCVLRWLLIRTWWLCMYGVFF